MASDSACTAEAYTWAVSGGASGCSSRRSWCSVGVTLTANHITLGLGDEATCTITNNDKPPVLHLRKVVVNDNGGTASVSDFTLTANGAGTNDLSGTSPVDSDGTLQARSEERRVGKEAS